WMKCGDCLNCMTIRAMEIAIKFIFLLILYPAFSLLFQLKNSALVVIPKIVGCQGFMILQKWAAQPFMPVRQVVIQR
ncbi:MAG: hypothetical protein QF618_03320, partial [SAR324 cluster bacterium]|nr:hypothetical protein [SAR324 cluster bacterium]